MVRSQWQGSQKSAGYKSVYWLLNVDEIAISTLGKATQSFNASKRTLTFVATIAEKVLVTKSQPLQSTSLEVKTVVAYTVLIPFSGAAKIGCKVVQEEVTEALFALAGSTAREDRQRARMEIMMGVVILSLLRGKAFLRVV